MQRRAYNLSEAAALLSVSKRTVERLIQRGDLETRLVLGCRRIEVTAIEAYLAGAGSRRQRKARA